MGLLAYFANKFYEPIEPARAPILGQIAWVPVPNLLPQPNVIEAERAQDTSHAAVRARWIPINDTHFTRRDGKTLPILNFRLGETEEMLAFKAKRRPAIVVATGAAVLGGIAAPPHHTERRIVVAPIYGIRSDDDQNGFSTAMAIRVRHLLYRQYFPMASWIETRPSAKTPGACALTEGVARFDRLQFVLPAPPGCRLVPLRVSDDILALMHYSLWMYLHADPHPTLVEFRDVFRDCLPPETAPPG